MIEVLFLYHIVWQIHWVQHLSSWKYDKFRSLSGTSKIVEWGIDYPWVLAIKKIAIILSHPLENYYSHYIKMNNPDPIAETL